ncbi:MAG TPA: SDR family oxidoreductase [Frankiaceae bacterium]|jgi:3-oxoacyl-[acyl-carrier protein] reductase|nr:SDR family oxidoreductase [Frankiaceae bacterium]
MGEKLLSGRTVIVTGAGGGVGAGIALACAEHGANVVIAARRTETGDVIAQEIESRGGAALSIRCDVGEASDVNAAVASTIERFGALDCMVHNALAPVGPPRGIRDVPDDVWEAMLSTAVRASYLCARAAFPQLRDRQGSLILLTSAAGVEGSPYLPAYGMVKAAQRGLLKSLAREWGPLGIRVNGIGPVAMTPAMEVVAKTSPVFTDGLLVNRTPLRRIGEPEADIGPVAVFLASDLSRYVTGQTLMVDGGGFMAF